MLCFDEIIISVFTEFCNEIFYASDYFEQLYELAIRMIKAGKAYVDEQTAEEIAAQKGTPTEPGVNSPYRDRPIEENLRLFQQMQNGEIPDGKMILRAKIDMYFLRVHLPYWAQALQT